MFSPGGTGGTFATTDDITQQIIGGLANITIPFALGPVTPYVTAGVAGFNIKTTLGEAAGGATQSANRVPGGAELGQQVTTTFKVASVDPMTNILWVTLPNGNTKKIQVQDPEAQKRLKNLSPGNTVAVTYTESMALQLEKLAK